MIAAVPNQELASAVGEVEGIELHVWSEGPPPDGLEFWVPAYNGDGAEVGRAGDVPDLAVVQLQVAGYDGIPELVGDQVTLCNARGVHDDATAEHAVGLVVSSLRGIDQAVRDQQNEDWQRVVTRRSLADSRVLIVGYGSIGQAVAERMLAMKAVVTAVASHERDDDLVGRVRSVADLPELLSQQHVVVVLLPLTEQTQGLVGADFLGKLPDGALVVNVARGPVVDTDAVLAQAGRLHFALDVTDPEPLPRGHPLWSAPNVLITPHLAGGTTAMLPRIATLVRDQLHRRVAGERLANVVSG